MLYDELCDRTNGYASYEEYKDIEKDYMDSKMTKDEAALLWEVRYGRFIKRRDTYPQKAAIVHSLTYKELSRIWNEVYNNKDSYKKNPDTGEYVRDRMRLHVDPVTKLTYTLVETGSSLLRGFNILTLVLVLGIEMDEGKVLIVPTRMSDLGNLDNFWFARNARDIAIINL